MNSRGKKKEIFFIYLVSLQFDKLIAMVRNKRKDWLKPCICRLGSFFPSFWCPASRNLKFNQHRQLRFSLKSGCPVRGWLLVPKPDIFHFLSFLCVSTSANLPSRVLRYSCFVGGNDSIQQRCTWEASWWNGKLSSAWGVSYQSSLYN